MWNFLRQPCAPKTRLWRAHGTLALTPSELRFKQKLEAAERERRQHAPEWEKREQTLRKRYGTWNPTHKLSRQQMNDIRDLKARAPGLKTVQLADFFKINPESIRRILKSSWVPSEAERAKQEARGEKRKMESVQRKRAAVLGEAGGKAGGVLGKTAEPGVPVESHGPGKSYESVKSYESGKSYDSGKSYGSGAPGHRGGPKYKHQKHGPASRDADRRWRKPFTEGVGDLLE